MRGSGDLEASKKILSYPESGSFFLIFYQFLSFSFTRSHGDTGGEEEEEEEMLDTRILQSKLDP